MIGTEPSPSDAGGRGDAAGARVRLLLCGDVMTGRGIDQIQRHPGHPRLYEGFVKSALEYVAIAEQANGPIPRSVDPSYVWGDVRAEVDRLRPGLRIVNLETAVTTSETSWRGKGIHYRMHPANVACLTAARIDCATLANNHVLDWGYAGLEETIRTLHAAGMRTAGAGANEADAREPAVFTRPGGGRVVVLACGSPSSGVPGDWAVRRDRAGVNYLDESDSTAIDQFARRVRDTKRRGDVVILSMHWGNNWGYDVPREQQEFAHRLIDDCGVDVVFGHSSHHPRPIEVHSGKLILYGCGDCLNDYEGIGGYEAYRPELGFMYVPDLEASTGRLQRLLLVPTRIHRFRVNRASASDTAWLQSTMTREGRAFGTSVEPASDGDLALRWS